MIYADFESNLMPQVNGNRNRCECYKKKYQKHVACSYDYKLMCANVKSSKDFKSYIDENAT